MPVSEHKLVPQRGTHVHRALHAINPDFMRAFACKIAICTLVEKDAFAIGFSP